MPDHRPRLTLWDDGAYVLISDGTDGSRTTLTVRPDGTLLGSSATPAGLREVVHLEASGGGVAEWVRLAAQDVDSFVRASRGALDGPWKAGPPIERFNPDGSLRLRIIRERDRDGNSWEGGHMPAGRTPGGWATPDNDWTTIWHPSQRTADGGSTRESFTYGTERYKGSKTSYSSTQVVEKDANGNEVRRASVSGSYNHDDESQERGVTIRYPDGSWVKQIHRTAKDGSWTDYTTTRDKDGHYVTRTATGHGTTTDTYTESESDTDPTGDEEDPPPPEPPDKDSPSGDGTDPGSEGNPEGPLSGVDVRDLVGDGWEGPEDVDTLGDVEAMVGPWLERIRAALAGGGTGQGDTGGLLDDLGAPPLIAVDLSGYEPDDLADHDSLGRPRPILATALEVDAVDPERASALTVAELQAAAERFAVTAGTVARSVPALRNR